MGPKLVRLFSGWLIVSEFAIGQDSYYSQTLAYGGHVIYPTTRVDWVVFNEQRAYAVQAKLKWNKTLISQAEAANEVFPLVYLLVPTPPSRRIIESYGLDTERRHFGIIAEEKSELFIVREPIFHFKGRYSEHAYWKRAYPHLYNELYRWLAWQTEEYPLCRYKWPLHNGYVCPFLKADGHCAWQRPPVGAYGGCALRNYILGYNPRADFLELVHLYEETYRQHGRPVILRLDEQAKGRLRQHKKLCAYLEAAMILHRFISRSADADGEDSREA
ncbi:MAG: hypothetical protein DRO99_01650 [Candidatus Aenigmatarchaeota archaeon]|nr:MAG: hypothetical protein DRO99_01650 [Candidatus Aenigmarchaeota archaeon]